MTSTQQRIQIKKIEKDLLKAFIAIDQAFIVESNTKLSEIKQRQNEVDNHENRVQVVLDEICLEIDNLKHAFIENALERLSDNEFVEMCTYYKERGKFDMAISLISKYQGSHRAGWRNDHEFVKRIISSWNHPIFITLTFKKDKGSSSADFAFDEFNRRLSKKIYKHAYKRKHLRLHPLVFKEGASDSSTKIHYHVIYELPSETGLTIFKNRIKEVWKHGFVDFRDVFNEENLSSYVLKSRTKNPSSEDRIFRF